MTVEDHEYQERMIQKVDELRRLEEEGVLGYELCPAERYWHWPVDKPADLPEHLRAIYEQYGEMRHYW